MNGQLTQLLLYILNVFMRTRIFKSGNSKAVRIPASIPLSGSEVEIVDLGKDGVLLKELAQKRDPWELFREGIAELGGEWPERVQEKDTERPEW
jgi:virulence-associated protein VagC